MATQLADENAILNEKLDDQIAKNDEMEAQLQ